ncbi:hypothetical protein D9M71_472350 [compost metagenome]
MDVNGNAFFLNARGALEFIASELAPTEDRTLLIQAFIDQALYHAWIGQGRSVAQIVQFVAGNLTQNAPHDLA